MRRNALAGMRAWALAPARTLIAAALIAVCAGAPGAHAAVTLGFVENWPGTSVSSWGGGTPISNPGTGGTGGAGDGYLLLTNAVSSQLGANSSGPEYVGNWTAAGITKVRLWLNDVNVQDPLEMHFSLGRAPAFPDAGNFWQYNVGFIPPAGQWNEFVVDLTSANWTQIIGSGSFANALTTVTRIHIRHDLAPYQKTPDFAEGDVGVDRLALTNEVVGVEPGPGAQVGRPVELAPPAPNPSRGPVTLSLVSPDGSPVHIQIVDAGGRAIRRAELPGGAGVRIWTWDGADDGGRQVAPGYYRARAWGPTGGTSRSLIRIR